LFRLLKTTVEDLLPPGYYTQSMLGVRVDERVLSDLLSQKLPKIASHIEKIGIPLSSVVTPWLMCLFINVLPFEVYYTSNPLHRSIDR
jgi:TBC1 domain family member 2B